MVTWACGWGGGGGGVCVGGGRGGEVREWRERGAGVRVLEVAYLAMILVFEMRKAQNCLFWEGERITSILCSWAKNQSINK